MKKIFILLFAATMIVSCKRNGSQNDTTVSNMSISPTGTSAEEPEVTKSEIDATKLATASSDVNLHSEYAKTLARMAYIWAYPMVNMINRRNSISKAPEPGRLGGVLPVAPTGQLSMLYDYIDPDQNFIACPNQDVVYGLGFFSLDEQPVVIQVPDFGDRFWVYAIYDARTDQVGQLGKPYGSKPGFYLLKGPNWKGEVPSGITGVITSPTALGNCIPRVFQDDSPEDKAAVQPLINQINIYPLAQFDGKMKNRNWKEAPSIPNPNQGAGGETKWVLPEKFFDQLPEVLATVPPLPGEEAMYGQFRSLLAVAQHDPEVKKIITNEVVSLEKALIKDFVLWKYNGKPAGNGWTRSQNNADWGLDYYNRIGTAKSNMFDNRPTETQYFYTDSTTNGQFLTGANNYKITFKTLPPVKGFWSMTMYNKDHLFFSNPLKRYSVGTKNKNLKKNEDGSLTIYAGNKKPGGDKDANWLPAPADHFSLYIRAYWGEPGITEGSWVPPVVEKY